MNQNHKSLAGMIFHPLNLSMVDHAISELFPFGKIASEHLSPVLKKKLLLNIPSFRFFSVKGIYSSTGKQIDFNGYMLPLLPEQMVGGDKERILERISHIALSARKDGARILTLGAFTSILTDQGRDIVKEMPLAITSGNTYTAALCLNSVFKIVRKMNIDLEQITIGIVGATGDIGSICAKVLASRARQLILCSRTINEHSEVLRYIKENTSCGLILHKDPNQALKQSDIIICATSAFDVLLDNRNIRPGSILCDLSMPPNIAKNILKERNDIIAYEAGRAKISTFDKIENKIWQMLFPENSIYGCLAESLILAFEERYENYSIGRGEIREEKIEEIFNLGLRHGFDVADFACFGYLYQDDDFRRINQIRKSNVN